MLMYGMNEFIMQMLDRQLVDRLFNLVNNKESWFSNHVWVLRRVDVSNEKIVNVGSNSFSHSMDDSVGRFHHSIGSLVHTSVNWNSSDSESASESGENSRELHCVLVNMFEDDRQKSGKVNLLI